MQYEKYLLIVFVAIVPMLLFVVPLFYVAVNSFFDDGNFVVDNYVKFFSSKMYTKSLWNSLFIASATTVAIAPLGVLIVWITRKYQKVKRTVKLVTSLPLVFSSYVFCIALIYIYGRTGIINHLFSLMGLNFPISEMLYSVVGIIFANILFFLPYFILPIFSSFEDMNPMLEEVAESLGSCGFHKFRTIVFPQIFYGFLTAFLLTFLLVFNQVSVVLALGAGRTYTLTYQLFAQYEGFQYGMANTVAVISIVVTLMIACLFQIVLRRTWKK